jgi:hypothetical protein
MYCTVTAAPVYYADVHKRALIIESECTRAFTTGFGCVKQTHIFYAIFKHDFGTNTSFQNTHHNNDIIYMDKTYRSSENLS